MEKLQGWGADHWLCHKDSRKSQEAAHPWLMEPRTKEVTSKEKERTDFSAWTNGDSLPHSKEIQATGNFQGIEMSKLNPFMEKVCAAPPGSVKRISDPHLS